MTDGYWQSDGFQQRMKRRVGEGLVASQGWVMRSEIGERVSETEAIGQCRSRVRLVENVRVTIGLSGAVSAVVQAIGC